MAVRPTLPIAGAQSGADPAVPPLPAAHHNGPAAVRKGWEHNEAASTALFREPSQLLRKKGRRKKKRGVGGDGAWCAGGEGRLSPFSKLGAGSVQQWALGTACSPLST